MNNFTLIAAAVGGALIGLAAVLLMMLTGRVAGISGIFGACFRCRHPTRHNPIRFGALRS